MSRMAQAAPRRTGKVNGNRIELSLRRPCCQHSNAFPETIHNKLCSGFSHSLIALRPWLRFWLSCDAVSRVDCAKLAVEQLSAAERQPHIASQRRRRKEMEIRALHFSRCKSISLAIRERNSPRRRTEEACNVPFNIRKIAMRYTSARDS